MAVYSIGDMAKAAGLSVRMLRHYDELGLLHPARTDRQSGYRYYEPAQLARLHRILALKDLGFTLAQVGRIVDDEVSTDELRGMLRLRRAELATEISDAQLRLRRVELHIQSIEQEIIMNDIDIITKPIGAMMVAALSGRAETFGPQHISPALQPLYPLLFERIGAAGLRPCGAPVAFYEDAPDGDGILVHAAVPIATPSGALSGLDGLQIRELPAFEQAVTLLHRGSMDECEASYSAMFTWIAAHGLRTLGYSREIYLDCPEQVSDWVTELQFPVAAA